MLAIKSAKLVQKPDKEPISSKSSDSDFFYNSFVLQIGKQKYAQLYFQENAHKPTSYIAPPLREIVKKQTKMVDTVTCTVVVSFQNNLD